MPDFVAFASPAYGWLLLLLVVARGMDLLSTRIATPNLVLEGNPIAKRLGWKWGSLVNLGLCFTLAFWPVPSIIISTTSVLVAARNFQSAWLMRSLGEQLYRDWHVARVQETSATLYLFCLFAQTLLTAGVGAAVIYFGTRGRDAGQVLPAIGVGIVAYAAAVLFFTLLAVWRLRRTQIRKEEFAQKKLLVEPGQEKGPKPGRMVNVWLPEDAQS
jgi:hypothetical protein